MTFFEMLKIINWDTFSAISSSTLIIFLMIQTSLHYKNQLISNRNNNNQLVILQRRQLKVDTFPYRRELYLNLVKLFRFVEAIRATAEIIELNNKSIDQINQVFQSTIDQHLVGIQIINNSLSESEYILPKNIFPTVQNIYKCFETIQVSFSLLNNISAIGLEEEIERIKIHNIEIIINNCDEISKYSFYISNIMPEILHIGELEK